MCNVVRPQGCMAMCVFCYTPLTFVSGGKLGIKMGGH